MMIKCLKMIDFHVCLSDSKAFAVFIHMDTVPETGHMNISALTEVLSCNKVVLEQAKQWCPWSWHHRHVLLQRRNACYAHSSHIFADAQLHVYICGRIHIYMYLLQLHLFIYIMGDPYWLTAPTCFNRYTVFHHQKLAGVLTNVDFPRLEVIADYLPLLFTFPIILIANRS